VRAVFIANHGRLEGHAKRIETRADSREMGNSLQHVGAQQVCLADGTFAAVVAGVVLFWHGES
jgi:hypothetical protein